jgi:hypothetical protein
MAREKLFDCTVLAGNASACLDLSGYGNALQFNNPIEQVDTTSFADLVRRREATLEDADFSLSLQNEQNAEPSTILEALHGNADGFYGWVESNAAMAEADYGLFVQAIGLQLERTGELGAVSMINISGMGNGHFVISRVLQQDESQTVTNSSTGFQLGALADGKTRYATMWVLSATAGTLDVIVESNAGAGFGAPNTQITFPQVSAVSAIQRSVAGPITDDYWRVTNTIATGPFVAVVMIGDD